MNVTFTPWQLSQEWHSSLWSNCFSSPFLTDIFFSSGFQGSDVLPRYFKEWNYLSGMFAIQFYHHSRTILNTTRLLKFSFRNTSEIIWCPLAYCWRVPSRQVLSFTSVSEIALLTSLFFSLLLKSFQNTKVNLQQDARITFMFWKGFNTDLKGIKMYSYLFLF